MRLAKWRRGSNSLSEFLRGFYGDARNLVQVELI